MTSRRCLREPIPEIFLAARLLEQAVDAHLRGNEHEASDLYRQADLPAIRDWTESIWGKKPETFPVANPRPVVAPAGPRMPHAEDRKRILTRDRFHCRFCGIPVIRREIRAEIRKACPDAVPWGRTNPEQHAAFQAMWLQFDHVLPYSRGGPSSPDNVVVTCAPCNFGRGELTLEEAGLLDPRGREPVRTNWDGLERFRVHARSRRGERSPR